MGICESKANNAYQQPKTEANDIMGIEGAQKEFVPFEKAEPAIKYEIDELYLYDSAMCKITCKIVVNNQTLDAFGTGFFCEINDNNIPFKKALFTNNHILNKSSIAINKEIIFENSGKTKRIKITKNRRAFTNPELDYTCIEIFDTDNINKFFSIDKTIFNNQDVLINKEIFILQYAGGGELAYDSGRIMDIKDNIIKHSVATTDGSSGSPLIKRYYTNLVIGIHFGGQKLKMSENEKLYNMATPFDAIIKDIKKQLSCEEKSNINDTSIIENINYRNKINLIYVK